MITDAEYILWCACRLKNKYAENNDIWNKLYNIGREMNNNNVIELEKQKAVEIKQKVFEDIVNSDYSDIEDLIK